MKAWNLVFNVVRKLKCEHKEKPATNIKENPKTFWAHVSSKNPNHHTIPELKYDGITNSLPEDKANVLNTQFVFAFTIQSCPTIPRAPSN